MLHAVLAIITGGLGVMVAIPPEMAESNLSKWLEFFRLPPFEDLLTPAVDVYVMCGLFLTATAFAAYATRDSLTAWATVAGSNLKRPGTGKGGELQWPAQEARWRQQMRNGQAAAELIMTAPTLADAKRVHVDFKATEGRILPERAHFAILLRLTDEVDMAAAADAANEIALEIEDEFMLDPESDDEAKALVALYEGRDVG